MRNVKCISKRVAVMVLSTAMLLSLTPTMAFAAEEPDDEANDPVIAGELAVDDEITVSSDGDEVIYAFTPEEDGVYKLESSADDEYDPYVTLWDRNKDTIICDDDGGEDHNFSLIYDLKAGETYYYVIENYFEGEFSYTVKLSKTNSVHVTFHANHDKAYYEDYDESGELKKVESSEYTDEVGTVIYNDNNTPYQADESIGFMGWSKNPDATEPDEDIIVTEDLELYAVWNQCYKVRYDLNGVGLDQAYFEVWDSETEKEEKVSFSEYSVPEGDTIWSRMPNLDVVVNNLELYGWSVDSKATKPDENLVVTKDMTVYAVWRHVYEVTFDANGGYFTIDEESGEAETTYKYSGYEGETVDQRAVWHTDYRKVFDGWYDQKTGGKKVTEDQVVTGNLTLYAHWSEAKAETINPDTITQTAAGKSKFIYQFTPQETGVYLFNSAAVDDNLNPQVTLYGSDGKEISANERKFDDKDFLLTCNLEKGKTYTFVIRNYNQSVNAYPIKIVKAASANITFNVNRKGVTFVESKKDTLDRQSAIGFSVNTSNLEMNIPESDNVSFEGWSTDPKATEADYDITVSGDMTLYAVWKNNINVTFDANGGYFYVGDHTSNTVQGVFGEDEYVYSHDTPYPNEEGYQFVGWSKDENATTADSQIKAESDMTLYAVWAESGSYMSNAKTLVLDQKEQVSSNGEFKWYHFKPEVTAVYALESSDRNDEDPYVELYDSTGEEIAFDDDGAGSLNFLLNQKLEAGTDYYYRVGILGRSAFDYQIRLTKPDIVNVTFDANSEKASFEDDQKTVTRELVSGKAISMYDDQPDNADETLQFVGWSTNPKATEAEDNIVASKDLSLFAVWKKSVAVTFNTNGVSIADAYLESYDPNVGRFVKSQTYSRNYTVGEQVQSYDSGLHMVNGRLCFLGWSTDPKATEADGSITVGESPLTLYAVWGENAVITFDANGGYFYTGTICNNKIRKGDSFNYYSTPKNVNEKKVFAGWATKPNAAEPDIDYDTKVTDDMTVYAVWKDGIAVTVDANGGHFKENGKEVDFIVEYVLPGTYVGNVGGYGSAYHDDQMKADWGRRALTKSGEAIEYRTPINSPMTLYVKWVDLVNVTFDAQDGTVDDTQTYTDRYEKGRTYDVAYKQATSNDVNKSFVGWSTKKGDESAIVTSFKADQDITLYAIYREGYKVTIDSADASHGWASAHVNGKYIGKETTDKSFVWAKDVPASDLQIDGFAEDGYIFLGYSTTKDRKDIISDNWKPAGDTTIYAIFVPGFEITFLTGEGYFASTNDEDYWRQVEKGQQIGIVETPVPPDGKVFAGWEYYEFNSTTDTGDWKQVDYDIASYKPDRDLTFRAVYADSSKPVLKDVTLASTSETYTGSAIKPNVTVKYDGKVLKKDTDYTVTYSNNINAGKATVTVTGKGNYSGNVSKTFQINPANLSGATISAATTTWNGSAQKPAVTVKYSGMTLNGTNDYSVVYSNNVNAGNGTVTVTGKGNYTGKKTATFRIQFRDVTDPKAFYYEPIYWAVDYRSITKGWDDGTFRYMNDCTRAAVVTFMWRHAGSPKPKSQAKFKDMTGNADFDNAISWAVEQGIVKGWEDNTFRPWRTCNRAAMMTFFYRYAGSPKVTSSNTFKDKTGNTEFDRAIAWGVANGITTGWDDGTFRPWRTCNRLATVTFLYRYHNSNK